MWDSVECLHHRHIHVLWCASLSHRYFRTSRQIGRRPNFFFLVELLTIKSVNLCTFWGDLYVCRVTASPSIMAKIPRHLLAAAPNARAAKKKKSDRCGMETHTKYTLTHLVQRFTSPTGVFQSRWQHNLTSYFLICNIPPN